MTVDFTTLYMTAGAGVTLFGEVSLFATSSAFLPTAGQAVFFIS